MEQPSEQEPSTASAVDKFFLFLLVFSFLSLLGSVFYALSVQAFGAWFWGVGSMTFIAITFAVVGQYDKERERRTEKPQNIEANKEVAG